MLQCPARAAPERTRIDTGSPDQLLRGSIKRQAPPVLSRLRCRFAERPTRGETRACDRFGPELGP